VLSELKILPVTSTLLTTSESNTHFSRNSFDITSFHLIGKETERGWEQNDDVSTLVPSLVRYGSDTGIADEQLRKRLLEMPLAFLESETGLSRHTIVRARRGHPVHTGSLRMLKVAAR